MSVNKPLKGLFSTKKKGLPDTPTFAKEDSASHMVAPVFEVEHYEPEPVMKLPLPPTGMKVGFKGTPAVEFVSQLRRKPALRKELLKYVSETKNSSDGAERFGEWLSDHGFAATSTAVLDALDMVMDSDIVFWAGRYDLFIVWSADRRHPWDSLTSSETVAAVLEIGLQGSSGKAQVLLNGRPVPKFTFQHGIFRTEIPIEWKTPEGASVSVHLQLQMSAAVTAVDLAYVGPQVRGVLWPAPPPRTPAAWPIGPPTVIGKVNTTARSAAISPGTADSLETFQGEYIMHSVGLSKKQQPQMIVNIGMVNEEIVITVNEEPLTNFRFQANNVLAWETPAHSAWLVFSELPAGPYFVGSFSLQGEATKHPMNVFGEPTRQPSMLASDMVADPTLGQILSYGVTSASVVACTHLLRSAEKIWILSSQGQDVPVQLQDEMRMTVSAMERFISIGQDFDAVFPCTDDTVEINITAAGDAAAAETVAATEVSKAYAAAEAASVAVETAEDESKAGKSQDATAAGAAATLESAKAAAAAGTAEAASLSAADLARKARTRAALEAATAAAQSYNQAKDYAHEAAMGAVCAAMAALKAVESDLAADYASSKDYARLKNHAEANGLALKAMATARETLDAWEEGTATGRKLAQAAALEAAEHAANCNTYMRAANRNQPPTAALSAHDTASVHSLALSPSVTEE